MAPPAKTPQAKSGGEKSSSLALIIALVVVTLVGGGGGFFLSTLLVAPKSDKPAETADNSHGAKPAEPAPPKGELIALPPIITNLAQPSGAYVRLEGSILAPLDYADGKVLAARVSEDVVALLRTTTLAQIKGASGFNHLRDDLNDRVKVRSEGKASELIVHTIVIE